MIVKSFVNQTKARTLIIQTKTREKRDTKDSTLSEFQEMIFIRELYIVNSELNQFKGGIHAIAMVASKKKIENTGKILAIQPRRE